MTHNNVDTPFGTSNIGEIMENEKHQEGIPDNDNKFNIRHLIENPDKIVFKNIVDQCVKEDDKYYDELFQKIDQETDKLLQSLKITVHEQASKVKTIIKHRRELKTQKLRKMIDFMEVGMSDIINTDRVIELLGGIQDVEFNPNIDLEKLYIIKEKMNDINDININVPKKSMERLKNENNKNKVNHKIQNDDNIFSNDESDSGDCKEELLNRHLNSLPGEKIRNRISSLSAQSWMYTDKEYKEISKKSSWWTASPSRYGTRLGRLIIDNKLFINKHEWFQLTKNEKNIIRECLIFSKVIIISKTKFGALSNLLINIQTLELSNIGEHFGYEGTEWITDIITSKYSNIKTVIIKNCSLNEDCIQHIIKQISKAYYHIGKHNDLFLKHLHIETNIKHKSRHKIVKKKLLDVTLYKSNIERIYIDHSAYMYAGKPRKLDMETPGGPKEDNPPRWISLTNQLTNF